VEFFPRLRYFYGGQVNKNLLSVQSYWSHLRTIYEGVSTMLQIMTFAVGRVLKDRRGVSAIEYTLLAVAIAAAVVTGAAALTGGLSKVFTAVANELTTAAG
jgi:Flp pilus assembly pilin Flp